VAAKSKDPVEKEIQDNLETAEEDKSGETKCDNHPQRKGRNFTGGNAYSINLCDECTPPWFKDEDASL
jgi:hypothetical protein